MKNPNSPLMFKPVRSWRPNRFFAIFALILGITTLMTSCTFKAITRTKNITYMEAIPAKGLEKQELNVFAPRNRSKSNEVLVFIHGGSWNSGKKEQYNFLGSRFARKGAVAVIIDYPLSPAANYKDMAAASAHAVKWVKENIDSYGGNANKIFVSGHSAGGHLATLISVRNIYFDDLGIENPIKGNIMIDAAGLDFYGYLKATVPGEGELYLGAFTRDTAEWKAASPLYHLRDNMPRMLMYVGSKTHASILNGNRKFNNALKENGQPLIYKLQKGKKHIPMITQFIWSWNPLYKEIVGFMEGK